MSGSIFFIGDSGELIRLDEQEWDKEKDFQDLLALHPDLLGADQINPSDPPIWLHIKEETSVPDSEDLRNRWSVDHLFIDQHGIPTLVEVKRSSDTRLRREVVGQMLDYAANSVAYWPIEHLQAALERRCEASGLDPVDEILSVLGPEADIEAFWLQVKTNLQAGRIRLLFVADEIPPELHRIVEFLNEQMDPAQVLAVEVRRFSAGAQAALVPRVLGQTAESQARKSVRTTGRNWDKDSVFEDLAQRVEQADVEAAERLFEWARTQDLEVTFGSGTTAGSFSPRIRIDTQLHPVFHVYSDGKVEHPFASMKMPFDTEDARAAVIEKLRAAGFGFEESQASRRPSIRLDEIRLALDDWLAVWDWFVAESRQSTS